MGEPKRGRTCTYSQKIADEICERLAEGESLKVICFDPHMPSESLVRLWAQDDAADKAGTGAGFSAKYARAREQGYERLAEEILEISDADCTVDGKPDNALVQQARLRVDSRKWLLSKLLPRKYGDRVTQEIVGEDGGALITRIELIPVGPRPRPEADAEAATLGEASVTPLRALPPR